jgi:hypothetical protein
LVGQGEKLSFSCVVETKARRIVTSNAPRNTGEIIGVSPMANTRRYEDLLDEDLKDSTEALGYLNVLGFRLAVALKEAS